MKCQKNGCDNEAKKGHKYCCRDHSPYGNLVDPPESKLPHPIEQDDDEPNDAE